MTDERRDDPAAPPRSEPAHEDRIHSPGVFPNPPPHEVREPITRLADVRAPFNVVAAFPGLREAREAIERLEGEGVEGSSISLLGAQKAEHAGEVSEAALEEPPGQAGAGALAGGVTGAAAGAAVGGIGGLALGLPGLGPLVAAGLWAIFGSGVGVVAGGISQIGLSQAWEHTFEAVKEGNVAVGVHTEQRDQADVAERVLGDLEPLSINRFEDP